METTDEIARLISEWRADVTEQAERFDAARRAIDGVSVTETAAGGAIVLTVASSGIPTDLRLGDDVGRMKPEQLAGQIMACLRRAQARLAERVGAVVAETAGDAAGAEAIAEEYHYRFPPPSDMDEEPPAPTEENAYFGLPDGDADPEPPSTTAATPVLGGPGCPEPAVRVASAGTKGRAPASNDDEDEDWGAQPW